MTRLERGRGGRERDARETSVGCLLYKPRLGSNQKIRHMPWLESNPNLFVVWNNDPTNWATQPWLYKYFFLKNQMIISVEFLLPFLFNLTLWRNILNIEELVRASHHAVSLLGGDAFFCLECCLFPVLWSFT